MLSYYMLGLGLITYEGNALLSAICIILPPNVHFVTAVKFVCVSD